MIPRIEGVSSTSTVWLIFLSPKALTQATCLGILPYLLFIRVTFIVFAVMTNPLFDQLISDVLVLHLQAIPCP